MTLFSCRQCHHRFATQPFRCPHCRATEFEPSALKDEWATVEAVTHVRVGDDAELAIVSLSDVMVLVMGASNATIGMSVQVGDAPDGGFEVLPPLSTTKSP
jgi:uncharacterized OB-fold protein